MNDENFRTLNEFVLHFLKNDFSEKEEKKRQVRNEWLEETGLEKNFDKIGDKDVKILFKLIDNSFFHGCIEKWLRENNLHLVIKVNNRLTKSAGIFKYRKDNEKKRRRKSAKWPSFSIEISHFVFSKCFSNNENTVRVNGLNHTCKLECLQSVLEHELVHFLVHTVCPNDVKKYCTSHGKYFVLLVKNIFGHTETKHDIFGGDAETKLNDLLKSIEWVKNHKEIKFRENENDIITLKIISTRGTKTFSAMSKDTNDKRIWRIPYLCPKIIFSEK